MTKDFKNQRREDPQSDSRGSSSRRFEEERPSRPARPRLNRDMVDRAWENGARQNHADYRARSDSNTHSTRDNRRPNQHTNRYPAQNSNNSRKPYGNRPDNYRPGGRSSQSNNGPRNFDSSMRTFDDQHYNQYEHRGYSKQPFQDDYRPGNSRNPQPPHSRTPYQGRGQYRGPQQREFDRSSSSPRNFDSNQRQTRGYDRDTRQPRSYDRDRQSSRNTPGPDTQNPRWQSRPEKRQNNYSNKSYENTRYKAERELYEGDYEHFDSINTVQPRARQTKVDTHTSRRPEERNVTHLPNGRVLKGTPDEQQQDAEFWTEIAQESDELVKQVESSHTQESSTKHPADLTTASTKRKTSSRTHTASDSKRERKTTKSKVRQSTPKPRSTGPKPSQRGYKWPTPEE